MNVHAPLTCISASPICVLASSILTSASLIYSHLSSPHLSVFQCSSLTNVYFPVQASPICISVSKPHLYLCPCPILTKFEGPSWREGRGRLRCGRCYSCLLPPSCVTPPSCLPPAHLHSLLSTSPPLTSSLALARQILLSALNTLKFESKYHPIFLRKLICFHTISGHQEVS